MVSHRSISIIVYSNEFGRIHYALSTAAAALATNTPVTLMFTMGAIQAVTIDLSGNPQWKELATNNQHDSADTQDRINQQRGVAGFEELLDACKTMGGHFLVCEMGLKSAAIEKQQLRTDMDFSPGGLVTFLNSAKENGHILFI